MTDIIERLCAIRAHLRTGALGQREIWEEWLTEAAAEIKRLQVDKDVQRSQARNAAYEADIERLRAERDDWYMRALRAEAALQPFAEAYDALMQQDEAFPRYHSIDTARLRDARRVLESNL